MKNWKSIISVVSKLIILIGLILIVLYEWNAIRDYKEKREGMNIFSGLQSPILKEDEGLEASVNDTENSAEISENQPETLEVYSGLVPSLKSWFSNEDVVGYIVWDEVGVGYPIVQGRTNEEYLYKSVSGRYSAAGSIILDTDNSVDFSDVATIVYGHHMNNGSMFGGLESYVRENGAGDLFEVYTGTERITYRVVGYGNIDPGDRASWISTGSKTSEDFIKVLNNKMPDAEIESGYANFITLITCKYNTGKEKVRFGVVGAEILREPYVVD